MDRFFIISGCSGGGKSTLLDELARRGFATVEEPGRRVVREELAGDGRALPWIDAAAFARRITAMAMADYVTARKMPGPVFFDRGVIDAGVALDHYAGGSVVADLASRHRFNLKVFMAPPWPALFAGDAERRHDLGAAIGEYRRLADAYPRLGYEVVELPRSTVAERADFVLKAIGES